METGYSWRESITRELFLWRYRQSQRQYRDVWNTPKHRTRVLGLLCLLMIITYLDRVCISVAGPRIQEALRISPLRWGWVTAVFTIAYAIFEIPTGALGDRIGPRRVLTRIVLWWSAFTSLTGLVTGYYPLLLTRFLFGMGEAGAFPNTSIAIARWFPIHERGRAFGFSLMASQFGGRNRSVAGCANPDSLRVASLLLRVWSFGSGLERRMVLVVSRHSR